MSIGGNVAAIDRDLWSIGGGRGHGRRSRSDRIRLGGVARSSDAASRTDRSRSQDQPVQKLHRRGEVASAETAPRNGVGNCTTIYNLGWEQTSREDEDTESTNAA